MPDFLAGQTLTALHFTPTATDTEVDTFSFNATTYGVDNDSGTYNDCGVVFVAPVTGRERVHYAASLDNDTAGPSTLCAPVIREGSVIGSGTVVRAASDNDALALAGVDAIHVGASILQSGLTPGSQYNVRLEHRVTGGIGTMSRRSVSASPET